MPDMVTLYYHTISPYFTFILDIFVVYFVVYRLLLWAKDTHMFPLLRGILLFFLIYPLGQLFDLMMVSWLIGKFATVLLVLLIIIFQPELRRFLERVGSRGALFMPLFHQSSSQNVSIIQHLLKATDVLSKEKIGALIVMELGTNLSDYIASGVRLSSEVTSDLLVSLFWPGTPTHDGAAILQNDRIAAAGCLLPLTDSPIDDRRLGTRHRAALGISELSDALVIVVSEETGVVSLVEQGVITRFINREALETRLFNLYKETPEVISSSWQRFLDMFHLRPSS